MLNLLWLLLPVAAAAGWFAAKRNEQVGSNDPDRFWDYASNYHRGLNYLLNEQPDKAVDLFVNTTDIDQDTADTHLALGNMFRRRGEVDRAIRIHQSLIDKHELDDKTRATALFELARDYDKSGLLDRSENLFRQLIEQNHQVSPAYEGLLSIYERERDWQHAIEIAREYERISGQPTGRLIAHYYCELAEESTDDSEKPGYLDSALMFCADCARANMLWGELALAQKDYARAIDRFERIERQQAELIPEIIAPMFEALRNAGDEQALRAYIERIRGRLNAYSVIKLTADVIADLDSPAAADDFFKEQIVRRPSLKGLRDWAVAQIDKSPSREREKIVAMCDMLDDVVKNKPSHQCIDCGFRGQTLYWRCPSCGHWDTVQTVIGAEGE